MLFRWNDLLKVTDPGSVKTKIPQATLKAHCPSSPGTATPPRVVGELQAGGVQQEHEKLAERTRAMLL